MGILLLLRYRYDRGLPRNGLYTNERAILCKIRVVKQMLERVRVHLRLAFGILCRLMARRDCVSEDAIAERPWCFAYGFWEFRLDPLDEVVGDVNCRVETRGGIADKEEPE